MRPCTRQRRAMLCRRLSISQLSHRCSFSFLHTQFYLNNGVYEIMLIEISAGQSRSLRSKFIWCLADTTASKGTRSWLPRRFLCFLFGGEESVWINALLDGQLSEAGLRFLGVYAVYTWNRSRPKSDAMVVRGGRKDMSDWMVPYIPNSLIMCLV